MINNEIIKPPKVSPAYLVTFYFVAEGKSLSLASELLFLSQPTVCFHIRALERSFSVKLIHIKKKKVILTEAGEALIPYARQIYQQLKSAEVCLQSFKEEILRIGVALTLSSTVAVAVGKFRELYPSTKVRIKEGPSYKILEEITELQHDLAVIAHVNNVNGRLETVSISDGEKMIFVASPSDPICKKDSLALSDLNGYPLILPSENSATREVLMSELDKYSIKPHIIAEVDNPECAARLVEMGKGIALVLDKNVEDYILSSRLKVLSVHSDIRIGVDIVTHKDNPLRSMGKKFISIIKELYKKQL